MPDTPAVNFSRVGVRSYINTGGNAEVRVFGNGESVTMWGANSADCVTIAPGADGAWHASGHHMSVEEFGPNSAMYTRESDKPVDPQAIIQGSRTTLSQLGSSSPALDQVLGAFSTAVDNLGHVTAGAAGGASAAIASALCAQLAHITPST